MEALEVIRRGYRAIGPGAHPDVLAMFDQLDGEQPHWVVRDMVDVGQEYESRDVVAMDLFGSIPPHYEVLGAEVEHWQLGRTRKRFTVMGHYRARPRGSWDVFTLPFVHTWWVGSGRVERVVSLLDGIEVVRARMRPAKPVWWRRLGLHLAPHAR